MRAVWLDPLPVRGILDLQTVASPGDLRDAYREWPGLPLNIVSGYDNGDIAWQLVGDAPIRKAGSGTLPMAGWDPANGWTDERIRVDRLPSAENPEAGFIATANNKPLDGDEGVFIGYDYLDGYRLARIDESLLERDDWTLESVGDLQMDRTPIPWREMRDVVLGVDSSDPSISRALRMLKAWDGVAAIDSAAASVYELFVVDMVRRIVQAKAPNTAEWALGKGMSALTPEAVVFARRTGHLSRLLRDQPDGWFEEGWDAEIVAAVGAAAKQLEELRGPDVAEWAWGDVRPLTFKHPDLQASGWGEEADGQGLQPRSLPLGRGRKHDQPGGRVVPRPNSELAICGIDEDGC